ncbi:cyclophilin-like fold protein [Segatella baroniae]|uniref:cyclophilin-like fold protein n=1 Tax=Segatella baroniae TaxID=305719 RepID=UPI000688FC4F|nr:cyclophilin-like fold protein [Segatella baroniae]
MKQIFMILAALLVMSCSRNEIQAQTTNYETMTTKMYITIDGRTEAVTLTNNSATQALVAKLQEASVTVMLNSSGGFEIWGALGFSLPTSNEQINAQPGDIVLYNGSNICMFYGTNSWNYTLLGKIDGLSESELRTFLKAGESNISVTLSLSNTTGISQVKADGSKSRAYTLSGTLAQVGHKGIIIQNGKKIIRKQ